ncbi:MAG: hypothetical protein VB027_03385 [Gordonibacter sp.]|nr:hypothetical protein [Gordonibacter sp.]
MKEEPAARSNAAKTKVAGCATCQNVPHHLPESGKQHLGTDGKPMSVWQIWLLRLCNVMLVWAVLELAFGVAFGVLGILFPNMQVLGIEMASIMASVVPAALMGAVLNLAIGLLGIRGAKNPCKITLFFWITLIDAVLTAWAMASNISLGIFDIMGIVSGLFIIALAVCTWQVRGQTGYFDEHP